MVPQLSGIQKSHKGGPWYHDKAKILGDLRAEDDDEPREWGNGEL